MAAAAGPMPYGIMSTGSCPAVGAGGFCDGLKHLGLVTGVVHHDDEALHPVLSDHLAQPQGADVLPLGGQLAHRLQKAVGHLGGSPTMTGCPSPTVSSVKAGPWAALAWSPLEHLLLFLEQAHHGAPVR